jgi:hypothetical protein
MLLESTFLQDRHIGSGSSTLRVSEGPDEDCWDGENENFTGTKFFSLASGSIEACNEDESRYAMA